ncbi:hypothetical protein [Dyadobacter sp. CY312]|uniref:hypothetical protein n=1 Tax=Dyadobacter sp. CY312 TaxID=2907303 RepID=UPI001F3B43BC|nr:hypothetical protein [Dyadobacter sp. CY312]MCE7042407.1 hypothetical protein [Dyadobacter sp. CY312]
MKRRNFLAASTLSLGVMIQSRAAVFLNSSSSQEQNFLSYISISGAIAQNLVFLDDQQLEAVYTEKSRSLISLGYRNLNRKFYLLDGNEMAMFPLVLKNRETGFLDISGLFFRKNLTGNWQHCTTFSGYHFDAIKQASGELAKTQSHQELASLIMPVFTSLKSYSPGRIATVGGKMDLLVKIGNEGTTLDFKLIKGETPLVAKIFTNRNYFEAGILA